jgi:hypothetical protein
VADPAVADRVNASADILLARIETAVGEIDNRAGRNAALIKEIIEAVNGLRTLLGVVRPH